MGGFFGTSGKNGWSPVFAVISDSARRVLQVIDWTGGTGVKPSFPRYVALTGLTTVLADAIDIRGPVGNKGDNGTNGATGATGATGAKGATGDQGAKGDPGPQGADGVTGPQGDSAYLYIGYAEDSTGTGYDQDPGPTRQWVALKQTTAPITPVQADFAGLWFYAAGVQGIQGPTGPGYKATSANSLTISTGSKSFSTQAGLAYVVGSRARIARTANPDYWMEGQVLSYSGIGMVVDVDLTSALTGTFGGTFGAWSISLAGEPGVAGSVGNIMRPLEAWVTTLGNDGSGTVGNAALPYLTIAAATEALRVAAGTQRVLNVGVGITGNFNFADEDMGDFWTINGPGAILHTDASMGSVTAGTSIGMIVNARVAQLHLTLNDIRISDLSIADSDNNDVHIGGNGIINMLQAVEDLGTTKVRIFGSIKGVALNADGSTGATGADGATGSPGTASGNTGANGADGSPPANGDSGESASGGTGDAGSDGDAGTAALMHFVQLRDFVSFESLTAKGGAGGTGGIGGGGGSGGLGGTGGNGGNALDDGMATPFDGGNGGDGGSAIGGNGGVGGTGGNGGAGSAIVLADFVRVKTVTVGGGAAGTGGAGGGGGSGGTGGGPGSGGSGINGGNVGSPGNAGTTGGGSSGASGSAGSAGTDGTVTILGQALILTSCDVTPSVTAPAHGG